MLALVAPIAILERIALIRAAPIGLGAETDASVLFSVLFSAVVVRAGAPSIAAPRDENVSQI